MTLYYSFVIQEFKNKLQIAQNACLRFVYCISKYDHITLIYKTHQHLKIEFHFKLLFGAFLYTIYLNQMPEYLYNYYQREVHDLNLRNISNRFDIHQHKTSKFQSCFAYLSVNFFNEMEYFNMIQSGRSVYSFKHRYKHHLLLRSL